MNNIAIYLMFGIFGWYALNSSQIGGTRKESTPLTEKELEMIAKLEESNKNRKMEWIYRPKGIKKPKSDRNNL